MQPLLQTDLFCAPTSSRPSTFACLLNDTRMAGTNSNWDRLHWGAASCISEIALWAISCLWPMSSCTSPRVFTSQIGAISSRCEIVQIESRMKSMSCVVIVTQSSRTFEVDGDGDGKCSSCQAHASVIRSPLCSFLFLLRSLYLIVNSTSGAWRPRLAIKLPILRVAAHELSATGAHVLAPLSVSSAADQQATSSFTVHCHP